MKTITAITPQVKNAKRCNIFLDGEFFCGLSLETVMKNRLKVGMTVDEKALEKMQLESEYSSAMDKALNYLSVAVKSEKQTRDYLKGKGYTPLVIDRVLEKTKEYGFVDDDYFARRYAETYADKKGAFLIKRELKTKGIADDISEEVLEEMGDQSEAAARIAEKYMRGKEPDQKNLQKLYRHLLSKGFSYDDAKSAVEKIRGNED